MRNLIFLTLVGVLALLFFMISFDAQQKAQTVPVIQAEAASQCNLSKGCPPDHYAFRIQSGAGNVVGPKICFKGRNIMSHVLNNVGKGLNIVIVNGEDGVVETIKHISMTRESAIILSFLKDIKPGRIVLVASFDDVGRRMTDEVRQMFEAMGSTRIGSVKHRDSWVFAGQVGKKTTSLFEKHVANDQENNRFDGWPEVAEVGGCFPRFINAEN